MAGQAAEAGAVEKAAEGLSHKESNVNSLEAITHLRTGPSHARKVLPKRRFVP